MFRKWGIWAENVLNVAQQTVRDDRSSWVVLQRSKNNATHWYKECTSDGTIKLFCNWGDGRKAFLTTLGGHCGGAAADITRESVRALVHLEDNDNAKWCEHSVSLPPAPEMMNSDFTLIKAQGANLGLALTGMCVADVHNASCRSWFEKIPNATWRPLPGARVVVRQPVLQP